MKNLLSTIGKYLFVGLFMLVGCGFSIFHAYVFYLADCATVRTFWMLVHTPARCIEIAP